MAAGSAGRPRASWRALAAAVLALWLVPAVLALAPLWMPPLCCAVAAVRFRRARKNELAARSSRGRDEAAVEDARHRSRLLQRYLDDQAELVLVGGGGGRVGKDRPAPADRSLMIDRTYGETVVS